MTRKDYEKIAKVLRDKRWCWNDEPHDCPSTRQWNDIVEGLSDMLMSDSRYSGNGNKLFDPDKFIVACNAL